MLTEIEKQEADVLVENWETLQPVIAEVRRRTGCTLTQALLLWLGSLPDDEEPEPSRAT